MASEIYVSGTLNVNKGSLSLQRSRNVTADFNGTHYSATVQNIPTTAGGTAVIVASSVTTAGYAYFCNNDATNYCDIGVQVAGTFYPLIRIKPGEIAMCRLATTTLYALAHTAAVDLEVYILGD